MDSLARLGELLRPRLKRLKVTVLNDRLDSCRMERELVCNRDRIGIAAFLTPTQEFIITENVGQ